MMKALRTFLFKPLEYLLIAGIFLVFIQMLFHPVSVPEAWTISFSPALIWMGLFGLFFAFIFLATWISTSSTEM